MTGTTPVGKGEHPPANREHAQAASDKSAGRRRSAVWLSSVVVLERSDGLLFSIVHLEDGRQFGD
jgi:hypothetical protein